MTAPTATLQRRPASAVSRTRIARAAVAVSVNPRARNAPSASRTQTVRRLPPRAISAVASALLAWSMRTAAVARHAGRTANVISGATWIRTAPSRVSPSAMRPRVNASRVTPRRTARPRMHPSAATAAASSVQAAPIVRTHCPPAERTTAASNASTTRRATMPPGPSASTRRVSNAPTARIALTLRARNAKRRFAVRESRSTGEVTLRRLRGGLPVHPGRHEQRCRASSESRRLDSLNCSVASRRRRRPLARALPRAARLGLGRPSLPPLGLILSAV